MDKHYSQKLSNSNLNRPNLTKMKETGILKVKDFILQWKFTDFSGCLTPSAIINQTTRTI
jgi:hypothetical protein